MSKQIRPKSTEKRSHDLSLTTSGLKKAKTLQSQPTERSLGDDESDNS